MVSTDKALTELVTIVMVTIFLDTVAMVTTMKAGVKRMNRISLGDMMPMALILTAWIEEVLWFSVVFGQIGLMQTCRPRSDS